MLITPRDWGSFVWKSAKILCRKANALAICISITLRKTPSYAVCIVLLRTRLSCCTITVFSTKKSCLTSEQGEDSYITIVWHGAFDSQKRLPPSFRSLCRQFGRENRHLRDRWQCAYVYMYVCTYILSHATWWMQITYYSGVRVPMDEWRCIVLVRFIWIYINYSFYTRKPRITLILARFPSTSSTNSSIVDCDSSRGTQNDSRAI